MIKADLYGALSRGYCSEKNKYKVVDPDLIEAMADEILLLYCQNQGSLGTGLKTPEHCEMCGVCGSKMVYIRGKYPHTDNRKVCPTCCQERLDQIQTIADNDYGKSYSAVNKLSGAER